MSETKWYPAWVEHLDGRVEKSAVGDVNFAAFRLFGVLKLEIEAEILVNVEGVALGVREEVSRIALTPWGMWWMVHESPEKRIIESEWR